MMTCSIRETFLIKKAVRGTVLAYVPTWGLGEVFFYTIVGCIEHAPEERKISPIIIAPHKTPQN